MTGNLSFRNEKCGDLVKGKFPECIARKMMQYRLTNEIEKYIIHIPGIGIQNAVI